MADKPSKRKITRRQFLSETAAAIAAASLVSSWSPTIGFAQQAAGNRAGAAQVTSEQVANAVQRGVAYLRAGQRGDGSWRPQGREGGTTALALLTMLNAGVKPNDPAVRQGIAHLLRVNDQATYVVSLKVMVLAAADAEGYARQIQSSATWLSKAQLDNGMWTYTAGRSGRGDNSNTQFALLGLHEAANAGAAVPAQVWRASHAHFASTQLKDGGWTYVFKSRAANSAYGSMTAAGVASLFITGDELQVGQESGFVRGGAPNCGRYQENKAIVNGVTWLARNFSVKENPKRGRTWHYYYLYALERVGMTGGLRYLGNHDWYRQGAAFLVGAQNARGAWNNTLIDTAFAVLFLAKGNRPVLVQKLKYPGQWNPDRHDVANLTAFIDDKLGGPVTWQVVDVDAPVTDWLTSPILYVQGHVFPKFTPDQTAKLKQYVENVGTLVFEACCSRPAFRAGFGKFAAETFPEFSLRDLGLSHPVFHSLYELNGTRGVMGMDVGCRTSVFFLPNDMSCLWEQREIPGQQALTQFAFQFGANLAAYATGKEPLGNKLDEVRLPSQQDQQNKPPPRGAVQVARLVHKGDYNADPHAMTRLTELISGMAKVDVVTREKPLLPTDEAIYDYPVVFMTGHFEFALGDAEAAALAKYLQRGGTLLADACCGREAFDKSFRSLAGRLLDGAAMKRLGPDHPIFSGAAGTKIGRVSVRAFLAEKTGQKVLDYPLLEAGEIDGRAAIIYSPLDWSCGLEGDKPYACRGYVEADAKSLAANILLYAISF